MFGCSPNVCHKNKCCSLHLGYTSTSTFLLFPHALFGICVQIWMRLYTSVCILSYFEKLFFFIFFCQSKAICPWLDLLDSDSVQHSILSAFNASWRCPAHESTSMWCKLDSDSEQYWSWAYDLLETYTSWRDRVSRVLCVVVFMFKFQENFPEWMLQKLSEKFQRTLDKSWLKFKET